MDGEEFDHHVECLATESTIGHVGHVEHLCTIARKVGA